MTDHDRWTAPDSRSDTELAERVAELGERLRRGEAITFDPRDIHADELRSLLPTIRRMADLPGLTTPPADLGRLGDFRLVREVGRGGMGVVYEAVQVSLGRRVALKVLPNASVLEPRHLQRFQVEAQAAASLNHSHIVPVFATGSTEGIPYYAMRFIDGRDLARVIVELRRDDLAATVADGGAPAAATPLSSQGVCFARDVARLARQAAEALDHAHANDVLHRDIKPSNLMIDGGGQLWITDFGLARVLGSLELTQTGDAPGTPRYMSPEQALGRRAPVDGRTDVYSLGVTIYELLTLRPAYAGDDRLEVLRQIAHDEPTAPRRIDPTIPVDLETIVLKAMAKSPMDRYATAADLASDLGRFLGNRPILARRLSLADLGAKWMRRHRALVAGLAVTAGLIVVTLAFLGWRYTALLRAHNAELQAEVARADENARVAERHRRLADRHAYASTIRLVAQAVETRQFETAQDLLDSIQLGPDGEDPRGFTWHYLRRLARRELIRLPERDAEVHGISLSQDGRTLASMHMRSPSSEIIVWDLVQETPSQAIESPTHSFWMPTLTREGRILAATRSLKGNESSSDLAIWDVATGQLRVSRTMGMIRPLPPVDMKSSREIVFLDDERFVAYRCANEAYKNSVRIWHLDFDPGKNLPQVVHDGLDAVAFTPEGHLFAACEGNRLTLREVASGTVVRQVPGSFAGVRALALSSDGRMLAAPVPGQGVKIWDTPHATELHHWNLDHPIMALAFGPGARTLAAIDEVGLIHLWDRASGRARTVAPDELDRRRDLVRLSFSPDGRRLATSSHGNPGGSQPVAVWNVLTGQRLGTLPTRSHLPSIMVFTPDGRSLIVTLDRAPRIWHLDPGPEPPPPQGHKDEAWSVAFAADGKALATGSDDTDDPQTVKLWDPSSGRLIRGWHGGDGTVAALAFSPDGLTLASGHVSRSDHVRLWETASGRLLRTFPGHTGKVRTVSFSPDGLTLATAGGDRTVRLWDVATGCSRVLVGHTDAIRKVAFAPDGRALATASTDRSVRLWDVATGKLVRVETGPDKLVAVAFAADGATLATADETGVVKIRDAHDLAVVRTIRGESDQLFDLAFTPDGRSLATSGLSGVIRLWEAATGQELLTLKGHKTQVNGLAFAPDGSSLASCGHDGSVRLWRAGPRSPGP
jgi:eukaryotic-like serine/threonine-protein kinase